MGARWFTQSPGVGIGTIQMSVIEMTKDEHDAALSVCVCGGRKKEREREV